jgi:hypothetical protein
MCALKQHHPESAPENGSHLETNENKSKNEDEKIKNNLFSIEISKDKSPVAPRKSTRALLKRSVESQNTSAAKKAATKTLNTLTFNDCEKKELLQWMDDITPGSFCIKKDLLSSAGQAETNTPVLMKDQGQNLIIDWAKLEKTFNQNKSPKECTVLNFEQAKKFDDKANPFVTIILQNLKGINCNKCLADDSALENHGKDKVGTFRLKCTKCNSSGSIRTYANTIPFGTIKAVISGLNGEMAEKKKALTWCNLLQMGEENDVEITPLTVLPPSGQVKSLMDEVSALRLELQAAKDEIKRLKAPPAEKKRSFVDAAMAKPMQTHPAAKPMVIVRQKVQKKQSPAEANSPAQKPKQKTKPASDMELVFFKGVHGAGPAKLRKDLSKSGFEGHMMKDITYLTQDIVQILTYADKVNLLAEAMKKVLPACKREADFDPLDPVSYSLPQATKENVLKAYTSALDQSVKRLKKCVVTAPSLTRSMNFLAKVVATGNPKYASAPSKPQKSITCPPPKYVSFFEKALAKSSNGPAGDAQMNPATNAQ